MELLIGKAKEDFEKWFINKYSLITPIWELKDFYLMPFSMQYGVYVDFFEEHEITLRIEKDFIHTGSEVYYWNVFPLGDTMGSFETTRNEARTKAIEQANKIYNER